MRMCLSKRAAERRERATVPAVEEATDSTRCSAPGTYLVICNVNRHFMDGMIAYVTVTGK